MGVGFGVQCTGSSSQRLLEASACLRALLSDVSRSLAALLRSLSSLLRGARTSDDCQARAALLLAVSSLLFAARSSDVLRARAILLLAVFLSARQLVHLTSFKPFCYCVLHSACTLLPLIPVCLWLMNGVSVLTKVHTCSCLSFSSTHSSSQVVTSP